MRENIRQRNLVLILAILVSMNKLSFFYGGAVPKWIYGFMAYRNSSTAIVSQLIVFGTWETKCSKICMKPMLVFLSMIFVKVLPGYIMCLSMWTAHHGKAHGKSCFFQYCVHARTHTHTRLHACVCVSYSSCLNGYERTTQINFLPFSFFPSKLVFEATR